MFSIPVGEKGVTGKLTSRTDERSSRKGSHGDTTLLVPPQIGKSTADQGHGRGEGNTVDQAADNEGTDVLGDGAGNGKDNGHEKRCAIDDLSSKDFGKRSEDHGTCIILLDLGENPR